MENFVLDQMARLNYRMQTLAELERYETHIEEQAEEKRLQEKAENEDMQRMQP